MPFPWVHIGAVSQGLVAMALLRKKEINKQELLRRNAITEKLIKR